MSRTIVNLSPYEPHFLPQVARITTEIIEEPDCYASLVDATYHEFVTGHATHDRNLEEVLDYVRALPKRQQDVYRNMFEVII